MSAQSGQLIALAKPPQVAPLEASHVRLAALRTQPRQGPATQTIITPLNRLRCQINIGGVKIEPHLGRILLRRNALEGFSSGIERRAVPFPQYARDTEQHRRR